MSENAKTKAPITPAIIFEMYLLLKRYIRRTIIQKRKQMLAPDASADRALTNGAMSFGFEKLKMEKKAPII